MSRKRILILILLMILLLLTGCRRKEAGIANPASVYCEENGGTIEIREDKSGGQVGYCIFPDSSECEEWAYFKGECEPGDNIP